MGSHPTIENTCVIILRRLLSVWRMRADGEGKSGHINEEKYKYTKKYHVLFHSSDENMKADDGVINSPHIAYFPL